MVALNQGAVKPFVMKYLDMAIARGESLFLSGLDFLSPAVSATCLSSAMRVSQNGNDS